MDERKTVWIAVTPNGLDGKYLAFKMGIDVPQSRDAEEYINAFLETTLSERFRYSDWDFTN